MIIGLLHIGSYSFYYYKYSEIHSKSLMSALQSYWFIPHVTVYTFSYATLGAATIVAIVQIFKLSKDKTVDVSLLNFIDNIILCRVCLPCFSYVTGRYLD